MILNLKFRKLSICFSAPILAASFSIFFPQAEAFAKTDFKEAIAKFDQNLNVEMENYLKDYLKRNKVGFTTTGKIEGNNALVTAPDFIDRETVFSLKIAADASQDNIDVSGKVLTEKQKELIGTIAKKIFNGAKVTNNLSIFPYKEIKNSYGVVAKPYADLFVKPGDKELATQALMGTPLRILEISPDSKFARVQSVDDKYISWIARANILEMPENKWNDWKNSRNTIIVNDITTPSPLYFGTILPASGLKVKLPDGKLIALKKSDTENLAKMQSSIKDLVKNAGNFLSFGQKGKTTYLWGGTVGKNLDCSGFNQTIFRAEGILLPRDADQQQSFTRPVAGDLSRINELKPGDLLFFSEKREYATHTGIYIGNYKFIHSSSGGKYRGIKISTLKGGGEYDKKLQKMYFGAGRVDFKNMFK